MTNTPLQNVRPLGDFIIVSVDEPTEHSTPSGLLIAPTATERPTTATVVAVGSGGYEGGKRLPMELAVGDRIRFQPYAGTDIEFDGEKYLIMRQQDVLAKEVAVNVGS